MRRRSLLASTISGIELSPNDEIWYSSTDGNIVEPETYSFGVAILSNTYENGKGVIKCDGDILGVANDAFYGCTTLQSITLPNSVTVIGEAAFDGCSSLTSITIPNSVTSIGYGAFSQCYGLTYVSIGNSVTSIGESAFSHCSSLTSIAFPNSVTSIGYSAFRSCTSLIEITIGHSVTSIENRAFYQCYNLRRIICNARTAPIIGGGQTFFDIKDNGTLYHPPGSDYSSWLSSLPYYLGYYGWTGQILYTPTRYYDLTITADDVRGRETTTTIYWSCNSDGFNPIDGSQATGVILTGRAISAEFPQNTSTTSTVQRTITFEYQGLTATTTITQGVWESSKYTIDLNNQWQLSSSITNPDASVYDGVYESFSNKGENSSQAVMYLDIDGYDTFKLYIRSYAESNYDYVMVSQPDQSINKNTSYSDTSLIKAHTRGSQNSGTAISSYQLVEYTGLNSGKHRITILYRKDSSASSGDDRGYVLIPKNQ